MTVAEVPSSGYDPENFNELGFNRLLSLVTDHPQMRVQIALFQQVDQVALANGGCRKSVSRIKPYVWDRATPRNVKHARPLIWP